MRKLFSLLLLIGAMMFIAQNSYAQEKKETKDLKQIFEECGIGGLLFPKWPIGASVSNFTWDWGTTATTSGLTTPDACKGGKAELAMYIYQSYDSIEKDLAMGNGKYLDMLAVLSEKSSTQKDAFIDTVRSKFKNVVERSDFSTMTRLEKAKLMYDIILETNA